MQIYIIIGMLVAFGILAFTMSLAIKKHDEKMAKMKKNKGRNRYIPEYKGPGRTRM